MTKIHRKNAISKLMRDDDFNVNKVVREKLFHTYQNQIPIEEAIRNADPLSFVKISDDFFPVSEINKKQYLCFNLTFILSCLKQLLVVHFSP